MFHFRLSVRESACDHILEVPNTNLLGEFHQIYNFGLLGTKLNWLYFEVKRSEVSIPGRPNALF